MNQHTDRQTGETIYVSECACCGREFDEGDMVNDGERFYCKPCDASPTVKQERADLIADDNAERARDINREWAA